MIIKKIVPLTAILAISQICFGSHTSQLQQFEEQRMRFDMARYQRRGAVIGDTTQLRPRIELLVEIHNTVAQKKRDKEDHALFLNLVRTELDDAGGQDNIQALLLDARCKILTRHLVYHFGQQEVGDFISLVELHPQSTQDLIESHFEQAAQNYFAFRQAPKITPQGKTLIRYLTKLRDQNEE
jgi:hypothetical protein